MYANSRNSLQSRMKSIAVAPRPSKGIESDHLLAAAGVSKGLPLPPLEPPVRCGADVDVEDGSKLRSGRDAAADGLEVASEDMFVTVARPLRVDVDAEPVTMPEGPTAIGTITCKVFPLLSVVVCVKVDRMMLVSSEYMLALDVV
jgi:hypothetical protein